ncbi:hypothetical protein [Curtobacterium sp. MCLR17_044]|uniref:hypothetical protein n=1 Tax=Curtobacterium sp. MCLR17_044 TaxID=2175628 RepID=UPI000DAA5C3F|nr:hypothetical protein [Curtobacterium sp. MCLR17_044]PZE54007.1 hypothetical protein DEJ04_16900 [Curtobacterium sp. MCLR17_044]
MRKLLLVAAAIAAVVIAIVVIAVHRPTAQHPETNGAAPAAVPSASSGSDDRELQELLNTRLSTTGAQLSVGLPATLTIDAANGDTVYARVTMDELTKLPADQVAAVLQQRSALAGYDTVWTMPVSLTVLGVVDEDGTHVEPTAALTASDLARFTIATHPGADQLSSANTLTSPECAGLDSVSPVAAGRTLTWCIHAFADGSSNQPTGGQYETSTGTYQTPITWASKRYAAPEIP